MSGRHTAEIGGSTRLAAITRRRLLVACPPFTAACSEFRRVGSLSVLDLQVRYSGIAGLTASAGVRNLADRDPRGRMFSLSLAHAWR